MSKKDDQIIVLIREILEEQIGGVRDDVNHIKKLLEGNGKPGLIQRIEKMESMAGKAAAVLTVVGVTVGVYVRMFVEDVYKHIYGR